MGFRLLGRSSGCGGLWFGAAFRVAGLGEPAGGMLPQASLMLGRRRDLHRCWFRASDYLPLLAKAFEPL